MLDEHRTYHIRPGSLIHHADVARLISRMFGVDLQRGSVRLPKIVQLFSQARKKKEIVHLSPKSQMNYLISARAYLVLQRSSIRKDEQDVRLSYLDLLSKNWAKDVCAGRSMGWIPLKHMDLRPNTPSKSLKIVWFEWLSEQLWKSGKSRQRAHEFKVAVTFLKLFLPNGFNIDEDNVLKIGAEAERNALAFLRLNGSTVNSYGTAVIAFKALNRDDTLSDLIMRYEELKLRGAIVDSSPPEAKFTLFRN